MVLKYRIYKLFCIICVGVIFFSGCVNVENENHTKSAIFHKINFNQLIYLAERNGVPVEMMKELIEKGEHKSQETLELLDFYSSALETQIPETGKFVAIEISQEIRKTGPINITPCLNNYEAFGGKIIQLNYIIKTINDKTGTNIPLLSDAKEIFRSANELSKYVPFIDSYNRLYNSSLCISHTADFECYRKFYINLALFASDIAFIEEKTAHKLTLRSTEKIAHLLKLYNLSKFTGEKMYGLILSVIHWNFNRFNEDWEDLLEILKKERIIK